MRILVVLMAWGLSIVPAQADEGDKMYAMTNFGVTFNPLGVRIAGFVGHQWQLYESDHPAFETNFVSLQALAYVSPANASPGVRVILQPASFINVGVMYRYRMDFPAFSNGAFYGEGQQDAVEERFAKVPDFYEGEELVYDLVDETAARIGGQPFYAMHLVTGYSTLQFQYENVFAVVLGEVTKVWADLPEAGAAYSYESVFDFFIHKDDWVVEVTGIIGYEWKPLQFLLISSNTFSITSGMRALNVGPGLRWTITDEWAGFKKPTLLTVCRWHVDHLWRTNSPAIPNVAMVIETEF
jgi:hypothetical protein